MSETRDVTEDLKAALNSVDDLDNLFESTRQTFELLERWHHAIPGSDVPVLNRLVSQIKKQALVYFSAIDMSVEVSREGYAFASDGVNLCAFLQEHRPQEQVISFLDGMQNVARTAHDKARAMRDCFRAVRLELIKVQQTANLGFAQLHQDTSKLATQANRYRSAASIAAGIENKLNDSISYVFSSTTSDLLPMLTIPHLVIILPAALVIVFSVKYTAGYVKDKCLQKVEARKTQAIQYEEAITQIDNICEGLASIINNIDGFISWWSNMETYLSNIRGKVAAKFKPSIQREVHLTPMSLRWQRIADNYKDYMRKISILQDYYPMNYPKLELSTPRQNDFSSTTTALTSYMPTCETAFRYICTTPTYGKPELAIQVERVRDSLERVWEHVLRHLRTALAYHDDLNATAAADTCLSPVSKDDFLKHFTESAKDALKDHKQAQDLFVLARPELVKLLDYAVSKKQNPLRRLTHNMRDMTAPPRYMNYASKVNDKEPVQGSVSDLYHDPAEAFSSFEAALAAIGSSLQQLLALWRPSLGLSFEADRAQLFTLMDRSLTHAVIQKITLSLDSLRSVSLTPKPKHRYTLS